MRRYRYPLGALFALVLILAGCSTGNEPEPQSSGKQEGPLKIGAVMYARDLAFWQLVEAGMRDAAKDANLPIDVEVSNRQLTTEAQVVQTMQARGDNVLVVAPLDPDASTAALTTARNNGATVVLYNNRVNDESFKEFVGVDNKQLGEAVGKAANDYAQANLGGKAKVALLTGDTEPNGKTRKEAFLSQFPGAEVVTTAEAVGSPEAGAKAFQTVMQSHPETQMMFAWNNAATEGAAVTAEQQNSKAKVVGIDMSEQVADLMATGAASPVVAVADQHAYDVGRSAVQTAVKVAKGESVEPNTYVTPAVYTVSDQQGLQAYMDELKKATG